MTYDSVSARVLREYVAKHPENIVWSPDKGWVDNATQQKQERAYGAQ